MVSFLRTEIVVKLFMLKLEITSGNRLSKYSRKFYVEFLKHKSNLSRFTYCVLYLFGVLLLLLLNHENKIKMLKFLTQSL